MFLLWIAACAGPSGDDTSTAAAACATDAGNLCTWAGTGAAGYDGEGHDRLETMLYWPMDIELSPYGRPVISDWNNHRLRLVEDDDTLTTIMGDAFPGDGPADQSDLVFPGAPGTTVLLNHPTDVAYLPDGTLILAAWHNHKLRTWDPGTGLVYVHCGLGPGFTPTDEGTADATGMLMNMPKSLALDPAGNIYFIDQKNERVRELTADFQVRTIAGNGTLGFGGDGGPATAAVLGFPTSAQPEPGGAIAIGPDGNLYIADTENNRIRKIDLTSGMIDTIAGTGDAIYSGDGGPALQAGLNHPRDLEFDADGLLWIADTDNHAIRTMDLTSGVINTVAGTGTEGFSGDGGPATQAALYRPFGVAIAPDGNVYISDTYNHRIRVLYR